MKTLTPKTPLVLPSMILSLSLMATPSLAIDCKKASTPVELRICANSSLMELDRKLGVAYREAGRYFTALLKQGSIGDLLKTPKEVQIDWLKERDRCQNDDCIESSYTMRIRELTPQLTETPVGSLAIIQRWDGDSVGFWISKATPNKLTYLGSIRQQDEEEGPVEIKLDATKKTLEFTTHQKILNEADSYHVTHYVAYWGEASPVLAGFSKSDEKLTVNGEDFSSGLNGNKDFKNCPELYQASANNTLCGITDKKCLKLQRSVSASANKLRPTLLGVRLGEKDWKFRKPITVACTILETARGEEAITFHALTTARIEFAKFDSNPPRALLELIVREKPGTPERRHPLTFKLLTRELELP